MRNLGAKQERPYHTPPMGLNRISCEREGLILFPVVSELFIHAIAERGTECHRRKGAA
jgi:hypothetical protein